MKKLILVILTMAAMPLCFASSVADSVDSEVDRALKFLYEYMPAPDKADYSPDFYKRNVEYALKARSEMPWGKSLPDREFYHFVLPVRVNNENLDDFRSVYYNELKQRVLGLSMAEAALEVNHWCHEKVTYHPSDSRTLSPMATVKTALGRCGEESTFTVAAMRCVGIPARQVYTPRWAHTDDNHAWVEVWVDGSWHFLGACEPEPVLDLGWFNSSASRAMLMHTKVFGQYSGPEEVMSRNNCFTEINVTSNYAPVAEIKVQVVDYKGFPVPKAKVEFKVYNYAELYTVCTKEADSEGVTSITAGLGDIVVWASSPEGSSKKWGFSKCSVGKDKEVVVKLEHSDYQGVIDLDITPPVERNTIPKLTKAQVADNEKRKAVEDSIRQAYVATFAGAPSRGNHATIARFFTEASPKALAHKLLQVLNPKDLYDISLAALNDHLQNTPDLGDTSDFYCRYVMNPRIDNEMIYPYKKALQKAFKSIDTEGFRANPALLAEWVVKNIRVIKGKNPQNLRQNPVTVMQLRKADEKSREIFFVAAARSLGIYARKDEVTGKIQWLSRDKGVWNDVNLSLSAEATASEKPDTQQGTLYATYSPSGRLENPQYYSHFTISKLENGRLTLLNYPEGIGYQELLKNGLKLDAGDYLITSGTRLSGGGALARLDFVKVEAGKDTHTELVMRTAEDKVSVIGNFNSENLYLDLATGSEKSLLSSTGRGYYILGLITPNHEPTVHALKDIAKCVADFEKWGRKIVLLFDSKEAAERYKKNAVQMPSNVIYGIDTEGIIASEIKAGLNLQGDERPLFIIADTFNRIVFYSQGYTISLGEQLLKIIGQL